MAEVTYYSLLEISERASEAEIKTAYLRLVREVHPDRVASAPAYWQRQAEQKTKEINEAYSTLSNRERRRWYDAQLAAHRRDAAHQTASQTRSSSGASADQQRRTSSQPRSGPAPDAESAQSKRSAYQQRSEASNSASSAYQGPQASGLQFASRLTAGQRLFFGLVLSLFAVPAANGFVTASSAGEAAFLFIIAIVLFFAVACLYQRPISRLLLALHVRQPRQQIRVTLGVIALILSGVKIVHPRVQTSNLGNLSPAPVSNALTTGATGPQIGSDLQGIPASNIPANSLDNGTEIRRRAGTSGLGELTVQNGNTEDAVVVLVNAVTNRTIREFYVRSGASFTEKRISTGTYVVYFFTGSDWNPSARSFNRDIHTLRFDKELEYTETTQQKEDGVLHFFDTHEITLQPVVGGNVSTSPVDNATLEQLLDQPEQASDTN